MLQYAIDIASKSFKHVDDVPNGKRCNCRCPECGDLLEAHNGGKIQAHHFKHTSQSETRSCLMTQLHLWGQYYFHNAESFLIEAPVIYHQNRQIDGDQYITIRKNTSELERRVDTFYADVFLQTEVEDLVVEIKVTHACEQRKIDYLQDNEIASVEIDLSDYIDTPIDQIEKEFKEHEMNVEWIYPYNKVAVINNYLIEEEVKRQQRKSEARDNAVKVLESLTSSKSIVLPALTTRYPTIDSNGHPISKLLVLQKKTRLEFDYFTDLSTDEYFWYVCKYKRKSLNVIGYFEDMPDVVNNINESTVVLRPSRHVLEWEFHSREEELKEVAVNAYQNKINSKAYVERVIDQQKNLFIDKEYHFKSYYQRWRSIIVKHNLFKPWGTKKNPPIPKGMRFLNKNASLWMFDTWPVYTATLLIRMIDSIDEAKLSCDALFTGLSREVGISKEYEEIVNYMKKHKIDPNNYGLDKASIINSMLSTLVDESYLISLDGFICKTSRTDDIFSYLYSFQ